MLLKKLVARKVNSMVTVLAIPINSLINTNGYEVPIMQDGHLNSSQLLNTHAMKDTTWMAMSIELAKSMRNGQEENLRAKVLLLCNL